MNDFGTVTRWNGCQVCLFPKPFRAFAIFRITRSRAIGAAPSWAFWLGVHVTPRHLVRRQNTWNAMVAESARSRHDNNITTTDQQRRRLLVYPESTQQEHGTLTETKNIKLQSLTLRTQCARPSWCFMLTLWCRAILKITWQCLDSPHLYSSLLQITPGILVFCNITIYTSVTSHKTTSFQTVPELFSARTVSDVLTSTFTIYWKRALILYIYSSLTVQIGGD